MQTNINHYNKEVKLTKEKKNIDSIFNIEENNAFIEFILPKKQPGFCKEYKATLPFKSALIIQ